MESKRWTLFAWVYSRKVRRRAAVVLFLLVTGAWIYATCFTNNQNTLKAAVLAERSGVDLSAALAADAPTMLVETVVVTEYGPEASIVVVNPLDVAISYLGRPASAVSPPSPAGSIHPIYRMQQTDATNAAWHDSALGWCGTGVTTMSIPPGHAGRFRVGLQESAELTKVGFVFSWRRSDNVAVELEVWSPAIETPLEWIEKVSFQAQGGRDGEATNEQEPPPSPDVIARRVGEFLEIVHPAYAEYRDAADVEEAYVRLKQGDEVVLSDELKADPEYIRLFGESARTYHKYFDLVREHWPYPIPDDEAERTAAFEKANEASRDYYQGRLSRDEAVAVWMRVTDQFPGTRQGDEAYIRAATLFTNVPPNNENLEPRNTAGGVAMYRQLVEAPGPPSFHTIGAEQNIVANMPRDAGGGRIAQGLELYERFAERNNVRWIMGHVLLPRSTETPVEMTRRVDDYARNIPRTLEITAKNVLFRVSRLPDAEAQFGELRERYAGDEVMLKVIAEQEEAPRPTGPPPAVFERMRALQQDGANTPVEP